MKEHEKITLSVLTGLIAAFSQQYLLIFVLVCVGIVLDCITGLIKSKVLGIPISSKRGFTGFWKKVGLITAFAFGIFLDFSIPFMLDVISIDLPFSPFALIIGAYIVLNESISIAENLVEINPESVPKWLTDLLKTTANKLNDKNKEDKK